MHAPIRTTQPRSPLEPGRNPVDSFSDCHAGILAGLDGFTTLSPLVEAAQRMRALAKATMELFDHAVMEHHGEEEEELFPAVLRSAQPGDERARVERHVHRLTQEHREIEDLWKRLRPEVARAAAGKPASVPQAMVDTIAAAYRRHAAFEEAEFLPLAAEILGRNGNHMAALGLTLHMRHVPIPLTHI